jgi:hypothetical protein
MNTHRLPEALIRETAREITIQLAKLTDSVTLTNYAQSKGARLRIKQLSDGRCLFCLIADRVAVTPQFTDGHSLLSHIYEIERAAVIL